uniref:Protein-S-isoprenylcysteine O-methyltransferase n=1 Tax=Ciona savignyi TaxID=51511 RepID=H2ZAC1_CIOSA
MIVHAKIALLSIASCALWSSVYFIWQGQVEDIWLICSLIGAIIISHVWLAANVVKQRMFSVTWRSYLLTSVFLLGVSIINFTSSIYLSFGLYLCILSMFHMGEYLTTALFNPSTISLSSFILNHSVEFNIAMILSFVEHGTLLYFFPGIKTTVWVIWTGFVLCISGDVFRKIAMYTAGTNFTHLVQYQKNDSHELVMNGLYSLVRHPAYSGWFCWSISTQLLLINPICLVGYTIATWKFFQERIYFEEITLLNFFGQQYLDYKKTVPSGIPFVSGYNINQRLN